MKRKDYEIIKKDRRIGEIGNVIFITWVCTLLTASLIHMFFGQEVNSNYLIAFIVVCGMGFCIGVNIISHYKIKELKREIEELLQ